MQQVHTEAMRRQGDGKGGWIESDKRARVSTAGVCDWRKACKTKGQDERREDSGMAVKHDQSLIIDVKQRIDVEE